MNETTKSSMIGQLAFPIDEEESSTITKSINALGGQGPKSNMQ